MLRLSFACTVVLSRKKGEKKRLSDAATAAEPRVLSRRPSPWNSPSCGLWCRRVDRFNMPPADVWNHRTLGMATARAIIRSTCVHRNLVHILQIHTIRCCVCGQATQVHSDSFRASISSELVVLSCCDGRLVGPANQRTLADIEDAFYGIFANFPSKTLSLAMRGVAFPTGRCYQPPSDTLAQEVSQLISTDTQVSSCF